jgi:hypothetical protein
MNLTQRVQRIKNFVETMPDWEFAVLRELEAVVKNERESQERRIQKERRRWLKLLRPWRKQAGEIVDLYSPETKALIEAVDRLSSKEGKIEKTGLCASGDHDRCGWPGFCGCECHTSNKARYCEKCGAEYFHVCACPTTDQKGMTDKETVAHLRKWTPGGPFGWPTDACGYDQHIRFVKHRNANWKGGSPEEFLKFVRDYADALERTSDKGGQDDRA